MAFARFARDSPDSPEIHQIHQRFARFTRNSIDPFCSVKSFKSGYVGANGSLYNMVVDKNTKRIWLEPLQRGLPAVPTDYNKAGEYIGERKLEDGKC